MKVVMKIIGGMFLYFLAITEGNLKASEDAISQESILFYPQTHSSKWAPLSLRVIKSQLDIYLHLKGLIQEEGDIAIFSEN